MQKQACAAAPASDPAAAAAAKPVPWSSARKKAIGPEVSGSPTSQPPTASPHRRPTPPAARVSSGVRTILRGSVPMGAFHKFPPPLRGGGFIALHHASVPLRRNQLRIGDRDLRRQPCIVLDESDVGLQAGAAGDLVHLG